MFTKTLLAGWGDMDFNAHMANTAYLDKAGDVRMMFFAEHGFPTSEFVRLRIGPVILKDEVEYFREVHLLEEITVTLAAAGWSDDFGRFLLRNDIYRHDGRLAARVSSLGGWMDLAARKLVPAPAALVEVLKAMPTTDDFAGLGARVGRTGPQAG